MRSENALIAQYAHQYIKAYAKLIFLIAVPLSILFFIVALVYDVRNYDLIGSFLPILCGLAALAFFYIRTLRFAALIHRQEELLNAEFPNTPLAPLYPKTLYYHSDDWFVRAGSWAFHRDYIKKISIRVLNKNSPSRSYKVDVLTTDHKTIILQGMHSGEIKKFKLWIASPAK